MLLPEHDFRVPGHTPTPPSRRSHTPVPTRARTHESAPRSGKISRHIASEIHTHTVVLHQIGASVDGDAIVRPFIPRNDRAVTSTHRDGGVRPKALPSASKTASDPSALHSGKVSGHVGCRRAHPHGRTSPRWRE